MITQKGVFGIVQGHQNRPLAIDPKSGALFVGVGSSGNVGVEPEPKATIQRSMRTARIRRLMLGHAQPDRARVSAADRRPLRDGAGARRPRRNLPSDYLTRVQQGGFYGWPYAISANIRRRVSPTSRRTKWRRRSCPTCCSRRTRRCSTSCFMTASVSGRVQRQRFRRAEGSWNRDEPTGYKVVRVPFKDGKPEGYYENFATGFWVSGERRAEVWGRPAALAVTRDGASARGRRYRRDDLARHLYGSACQRAKRRKQKRRA